MGGFIATGLLMIDVKEDVVLPKAIGNLVLLLIGVVIGALFATLNNDYHDLKTDMMNHRYNRLQGLPRRLSFSLIILTVIFGLTFAYSLRSNTHTLIAYLSAWVIFAIYDIPPFRLKNRGVWGAMADASGAHLFPTLFIAFGMQSYLHLPIDGWVAGSIAFSSWAIGFRSIVSHQYDDLENDTKSGLRTFAVLQKNTEPVKWLGASILSAEVGALVIALFSLQQNTLLVLLGLYFFMALLLTRFTDISFVSIRGRSQQQCRTWMISYYQSVMPLVLFWNLSLVSPWMAIFIPVYIFLFPKDFNIISNDLVALFNTLRRSVRKPIKENP